jgi:RNA polymerase sigma factor (sigma-70 family)
VEQLERDKRVAEDSDVLLSDEAFFDALFRAEFASLTRLAALVGADDPHDIAQEAFFRLHGKLGGLRKRSAALSYLRRTAVNLVRTRQRHLSVVRRAAAGISTGHAASSCDLAVQAEEHREVLEAIKRLRPRERQVLVMRYWLELTPADIAATLGMRLGTVKSSTSRALRALEKELVTPGEQ